MLPPYLADRKTLRARALFLGERLDTRALEATQRLAIAPLTVYAGEGGLAVQFRYGAVVLFDLSPVEEASFLSYLRPFINDPFAAPETEQAEVSVDPGHDDRVDVSGVIMLRELSLERLQMLADILAKSVVLGYYEASIASVFDRIEPLAAGLQRQGRGGSHAKDLLGHIGGALLIQHKVVGRVEVVEKPELLWEHPELERLYVRLEDEYELRERHRALDRKLALISRTATTLLELLQQKRNLRVEWYIVILIAVEILLTLYQMFPAR